MGLVVFQVCVGFMCLVGLVGYLVVGLVGYLVSCRMPYLMQSGAGGWCASLIKSRLLFSLARGGLGFRSPCLACLGSIIHNGRGGLPLSEV